MINFFRSLYKFLKSLILFLALMMLVIFMVDNRQIITITTNPFPFEIETRVFVLMISCFGLGFFVGILVCSPVFAKGLIRKIVDKNKIKKLEKQINQQN